MALVAGRRWLTAVEDVDLDEPRGVRLLATHGDVLALVEKRCVDLRGSGVDEAFLVQEIDRAEQPVVPDDRKIQDGRAAERCDERVIREVLDEPEMGSP